MPFVRQSRNTGSRITSRNRQTLRSCSSPSSACGRTSTTTGSSSPQSPLVQHLIETPHNDYPDPAEQAEVADLDELAGVCPVPADGSQLEAVAWASAGRTFVIEGPPGTGKSQTITNLLTRAVADGKKVLFVAEKRAALDVVSSATHFGRVWGPFCLDLHDKGSKPRLCASRS